MQIGTHSRAVGLNPKSGDLQTEILHLKLIAFRDYKNCKHGASFDSYLSSFSRVVIV